MATMHKDSMRKDSYICVECRYVRSGFGERCPKGHDLIYMGRNFKAPRKRNDAAWAAVAEVAASTRAWFGRSRRAHQTIQERRQARVPVRPVPGRKKGQVFYWPPF